MTDDAMETQWERNEEEWEEEALEEGQRNPERE